MPPKKNSISLIAQFLSSLTYLSGIIDMLFRFVPALAATFTMSDATWDFMINIYDLYTVLQYLPHILFMGLYVWVIRAPRDKFSYFTKYHVMHYLVLFTAEQLLYDFFVRISFAYFGTNLALGVGIFCFTLIAAVSVECISNVLLANYVTIPLVTDAVLVHIGDER